MFSPQRPYWILSTVILLSFWCCASSSASQPDSPARTVAVVIDYNDGVQKHFRRITWRSNMTVLDAMVAAQKHPRGIRFKYRGKGATALLVRIDDLENSAQGRNWLYRVNGKLADRSFGTWKVQAGDTILWKHEKFQ